MAVALWRLGYACLPPTPSGDDGRRQPARAFAWVTGATPEQARDALNRWIDQFADEAHGYWLMDAVRPGAPDLDVIDVDDPAELDYALATFGATPLKITTGRDGGGMHLYYLRDPAVPRDARGSATRVGHEKIDWRTWHGFVVAPGSQHRTGRVYRMYWAGRELPNGLADLTREMIVSLPVLDRQVVLNSIEAQRQERAAAQAGRRAAPLEQANFEAAPTDTRSARDAKPTPKGTPTPRHDPRRPAGQRYPHQAVTPDAVIPAGLIIDHNLTCQWRC